MTLAERHNAILDVTETTRFSPGFRSGRNTESFFRHHSERPDFAWKKKNFCSVHMASAILINPYINDRHVSEKEKLNPEEKQAIGKKQLL